MEEVETEVFFDKKSVIFGHKEVIFEKKSVDNWGNIVVQMVKFEGMG